MSTFNATLKMRNGLYVGTFLNADSLRDAERMAATLETDEYTLHSVYLIDDER